MSEAEFEKIFREHFIPLCNLAGTIVKDADTAKDIVQEVFVKLWEIKNKIAIHTSVRSYLYKAVINTGLNYVKKEKRFFVSNIQPENGHDIKEDGSVVPENKLVSDKVQEAIDNLPPVCQKVFRLSRFSDLTNKEIKEQPVKKNLPDRSEI